ncbi:MAG TPA: hypothetical protein VM285_02790 [Polyangia bacterium]|nr:hypothetical protein [Polyangia bacterium]
MKSVAKTAFALLAMAILGGCDQKVDEGDDKLSEGQQSIEVRYQGMTQIVSFDDLETQYKFNNQPVVALDDVILGSGLVLDCAGLWMDFVGTDAYSPACNDNCEDYAPVAGELAGQGYVERGTRRLLWEESLESPGCLSVKDVETITLADDPAGFECGSDGDTDTDVDTDTEPPPGDIEIRYQGDAESVAFEGLPLETLDGVDVVLLTTLFGETSFSFDLAAVELAFEGSDGYNPVEEGTCTDHLPAPGNLADQAGVDTATGDLEWDPELEFAGCAHVKEVAIVYVEDL